MKQLPTNPVPTIQVQLMFQAPGLQSTSSNAVTSTILTRTIPVSNMYVQYSPAARESSKVGRMEGESPPKAKETSRKTTNSGDRVPLFASFSLGPHVQVWRP